MSVVQSFSNMVVRRCSNHNLSASSLTSCYHRRRGVASSSSSRRRRRRSNNVSSSFIAPAHDADKEDLNFCKLNVRKYDPAGMLPGHLLYADTRMQTSYFAVRSFWVETGLRFAAAAASKSSSKNNAAAATTTTSPSQQLDWWQEGIEKFVFSSSAPPADVGVDKQQLQLLQYSSHPTLRLLRNLVHDNRGVSAWKKESFEAILNGRRMDLDVKQYETMAQLIQHAEQSCGNLTKLVLQSNISFHRMSNHEQQGPSCDSSLYEAARLAGICHGLTNALRTSIPVISLSGKLIIPAELTRKHGVKSPRYLLSALGQGSDDTCVRALQACVQDIVVVARDHLQRARDLRPAILQELGQNDTGNTTTRVIMAALLPGVASETFLNRLEQSNYQLTDSSLRHAGLVEHVTCAARMISAYYRQTY
jgi:phytoene/squalene synthetase